MKRLTQIISNLETEVIRSRDRLQSTKRYDTQIRCRQIIKKFSTLIINLRRAKREIEESKNG